MINPNETQMTQNEQPSSAQLEMHMDDEKNPKMTSSSPVKSKKGGRCCCITSAFLFCLLVNAAAAVVFLVVLKPPGMKPLLSDDYDVVQDKETLDITLSPKEGVAHEYSLIWLHGLNKNVREEFKMFNAQTEGERLTGLTTKILIPQAGKMTLSKGPPPKPIGGEEEGKEVPPKDGEKGGEENGGKGPEFNSWFDILEGDKPGAEKTEADWQSRYDQAGLVTASDKVLEMIKNETEALGGDASKVMVGGFSQGGVLSLAAYLRYEKIDSPLGGVFALSGMQGLAKANFKPSGTSRKMRDITTLRGKTPLFTYYGKDDKSFKGAETTYKMLKDKVYKSKKVKANWSRNDVADMGHEITKEELVELSKWLAPLQKKAE